MHDAALVENDCAILLAYQASTRWFRRVLRARILYSAKQKRESYSTRNDINRN